MELFVLEPKILQVIADLAENPLAVKVILANSEVRAQEISVTLKSLLKLSPQCSSSHILVEKDIVYIPGFFQTGVFRFESARKIISKRIAASYSIGMHFPRIFICSTSGFIRNFPSIEWTKENKIVLSLGDGIDPDLLMEQLARLAYMQVQRVEDVGEFCIRGSIVDFWTPGENNPTRVEIFGDSIDKIRSFRVADQRSFQSFEQVAVLPSREFVWPYKSQLGEIVEKFNHVILSQRIMGIERVNLVEDLKDNIPFVGIDDVSYMFSSQKFLGFNDYVVSLAEERKKQLSYCYFDEHEELKKSFQEIKNLYENSYSAAAEKNYLAPKLEKVFPAYQAAQDSFSQEKIYSSSYELGSKLSSYLKPLEKQKFSVRLEKIKELLLTYRTDDHQKLNLSSQKPADASLALRSASSWPSAAIASALACAASPEQAFENLQLNLLILVNSQESFIEFSGMLAKYFPYLEPQNFCICAGLRGGFYLPDSSIFGNSLKTCSAEAVQATCTLARSAYTSVAPTKDQQVFKLLPTLVLSETWLRGIVHVDKFEDFSPQENQKNIKTITETFLSAQFLDFSQGDLVVHVQHGIARFQGLMTIKIQDVTGDFLVLEYAGHDKIYVPIHKLNLVQKYIGSSDHTSLDALKSNAWEKRKIKARADVEKVAKELMEHQARRAITPGHAFAKIDEDYIAFEDAFPFDETVDQLRVIKDIMNDMSLPKAMDRLLCGDVGFGKTEVAMRAAYRCVLDGMQVAWLVPTTVLAHQHFRSLKERFAQFGVSIEVLDRSVTASSKVTERLKKGEIDILIGTHRLLSTDILFKDLGLLVVDEEQRFGVLQKERIKTMSYGIAVLTLTATPIPRTLQMAMVGLRDLSLLTTPPKARQATKTFVCPFEDNIIKESIQFEINRGGQVFYVHNRVEEIQSVFQYLQALIPRARICIGHGQLSQKELEKTILSFLDGKFDILLCTTIIESGVDMPNVNTILVQNADHFGLAQLYQLRGRVGRRSTRGYAYFLVSDKAKNADEGVKRLEILKEHQDLGSGFVIATHDLEMRGAGNILGDEQSGRVNDVGLETYMQMLDNAIKSLGGIKVTDANEVEIHVPVTAQIPENYIENPKERLRMYRRLFGAHQEEKLANLMVECEDRFGPLPEEVKNLCELARIRRWLLQCCATSLLVGEEFTEIRLSQSILQPDSQDENNEILVKRILDVCNRKIKGMRISNDGRLIFALRKKDFIKNTHGSIGELKRILSLLAGEM